MEFPCILKIIDEHDVFLFYQNDCIRSSKHAISSHVAQTHEEARISTYMSDLYRRVALRVGLKESNTHAEDAEHEVPTEMKTREEDEHEIINEVPDEETEQSIPEQIVEAPDTEPEIDTPRPMTEQEMENYIRWRTKYLCHAEKCLYMPRILGKDIARIRQGLQVLDKNKVTPLLERALPQNDSEEQRWIFKGALLKCNKWTRKHLLKKLGRPKSVFTARKLAASAMNNIRKENQRNNQIAHSRKIIARIQKFINITEKDEDTDQDTIQNAKAMLEDKII